MDNKAGPDAASRRRRRETRQESRLFDAVVGGLATGLLLFMFSLGALTSWPAMVVVVSVGCLLGGVLGGLGQMRVLWEIFGWGGRR